MVALEQEGPSVRAIDPATQAVWRSLEATTPLRTGERATLARFWLARDSYQAASPHSKPYLVQHALSTPLLAYTASPGHPLVTLVSE